MVSYPTRLAEFEFPHGHAGCLGADGVYKFNFERSIIASFGCLIWPVDGAPLCKRRQHSVTNCIVVDNNRDIGNIVETINRY